MATNSVSGSSSSSIVEQLVYIDAAPIRNNQSKISKLESKKKIIQDINTKVLDLQKATENLYKSLSTANKTITASKENIAAITVTDDAISGNINLEVKQLAQSMVVGGDKFSGPIGIEGSFDITVGDKTTTIKVTADDTISTLKKKINSNKDSGISASIVDGRLTISSKETGESTISFNDTDGILAKIGILEDDGTIKNTLQEGKNAIFTVNGIEMERTSNTIEDGVEGMTIKLQDVGNVSFTVDEDTDKLVESFEKFVESYNKTMDAINTELTKEGGVLKGDTTLSKLKSNLRTAVNSFGNSVFKNLKDIGLEMSSTNYGKNAKLEISDKDKLKNALLTNKSEVLDLFVKDNNNNGKLDTGDSGILGTLNQFLNDAASNSSKQKGALKLKMEAIDNSIKSLESRNTRLESSLEKKRKIYEKQFLYMDQMVSQMTSSGNALLGMLSSSSNNNFYF